MEWRRGGREQRSEDPGLGVKGDSFIPLYVQFLLAILPLHASKDSLRLLSSRGALELGLESMPVLEIAYLGELRVEGSEILADREVVLRAL